MPRKDPIQFDYSWVRDRRLTLDELLLYKNETDLPPCLVCGRKIRTLSGHLRMHEMKIADYRDFYGIPRFTKISSMDTRRLQSDNMKKMYANGVLVNCQSKEQMRELRAIIRQHNRPEIKSIIAIDNCKHINKLSDGIKQKCRKLASTHSKIESSELMRVKCIARNSHEIIIKHNSDNHWIKTEEHERRRQEVLQERKKIIQETPGSELVLKLAEFKERCRVERNRRIVEKRHLVKLRKKLQ